MTISSYTAKGLVLLVCLLFSDLIEAQDISKQKDKAIELKQWKFNTGNHQSWIDPDFDDSKWEYMPVPAHWEEKGYPEYNGFAVYRTKVVIPSSFKKRHMSGLRFEMGAIDDVDSVFVNGHFIGGLHDFRVDRIYHVLYNEGVIRWDKENVIAVKVLDKYGWGGMYKGIPRIWNASQNEFVAFEQNLHEWSNLANGKILKKISLRAKRSIQIKGTLTISLLDIRNNTLKKLNSRSIAFSDKKPGKDSLIFSIPEQRSFKLIYKFTGIGLEESVDAEESIPYVLTPAEPLSPRINGAEVFAVRPGSPVIYKVPASGERPMKFEAAHLPDGLHIGKTTGIITGRITEKGNYPIVLKVSNSRGSNTRKFSFVCGAQLALTPPMGWNSWNAWGVRVDQAKIKAAGDQLVATGLTDYGWSYINIDDAWQSPERATNGEIRANANFPDMRALTDYLHGKGLKAGLYSSPGPTTCAGYTGSMKHEEQDANTWAKWGFDYVKYDLCSYQELFPSRNPDSLKKPYDLLGTSLKKQDRDILYSLCQYGWGEVWKWGGKTGGSLWRTGDDIEDTWESVSSIGFHQQDKASYAGPGSWNDLDMLVVGRVGWGYPRNSKLTPDEQYTHIGLWSLLASPLLIGADLDHLDAFTKNLLCNHEVIAVNQDVLGKQGVQVYDADSLQIFSKKLNDGSTAIGIINQSGKHLQQSVTADMMGFSSRFEMRDLWRQKDLGFHKRGFKAELPAHGILLLKCTERKI